MKTKSTLTILLCTWPMLLQAGNWPGWRGGAFQGHAQSAAGPVFWSAQSNVVWKTTLPGDGASSPVVSEDSVYVTAVTKSARSSLVNLITKAIEYVLLLLLLGSGLYRLTIFTGSALTQQPVPLGLWARVVFAAVLGAAAGFVLFADSVVHFDALSRWSQLAVGFGFSATFFCVRL